MMNARQCNHYKKKCRNTDEAIPRFRFLDFRLMNNTEDPTTRARNQKTKNSPNPCAMISDGERNKPKIDSDPRTDSYTFIKTTANSEVIEETNRSRRI